MAVNIHITIIELNALHTKRQNLFQELDAVIDLLMEAKHWGLRKSRNATSLNSRFKSLDTLKVKKIGRAVQQECRDRCRMPSSAGKKKCGGGGGEGQGGAGGVRHPTESASSPPQPARQSPPRHLHLFYKDALTAPIHPLSLHDALPI